MHLIWTILLIMPFTTQGILIGDPCTNHTLCKYEGTSPVLGSKCTSTDPGNPGTCECGLGYYGETASDACLQGYLDADCSSMSAGDTYCQTGDPNSVCASGSCACESGYYGELTWAGQPVCMPIGEGAPCDPREVARADTLCQTSMTGGVCQSTSETCQCPSPKAFVPSTSTCLKALYVAGCHTCRNTGGICYTVVDDLTPDGCECPANKRASGDALVTGCDIGRADIGDFCEVSGDVECVTQNSACRHGADLTGRYVCVCEKGFVPVKKSYDDFGETNCYKTISDTTDPTCTTCIDNGGQCYDADDDGSRDGCVCPLTRSSSLPYDYRMDCDTSDFDVSCSANKMTLSYSPHNSTQYGGDISDSLMNGDSAIFIKGRLGTDPCVFEYDSDNWGLTLSLMDDSEVCGLITRFPNHEVISYQNWVTLKIATNRGPMFVRFFAYCNYDVIQKTMTEGADIMGDPGQMSSEGEAHSATIEMKVYDQFARDASVVGMRLAQPAQLAIKMISDSNVFVALRPDVCIISSNPALNVPGTSTILMLYEGCPEEEGPLSLWNTFHHLPDNKKISQTGLFPMMQFDDSDYVFFQCAVKVCRDASKCTEPTCAERRKRALDAAQGYSVEEGDWQSVRSAPIKLLDGSPDGVLSDMPGGAKDLEDQVCMAGRCMSKSTALGVIVGIALSCIFILSAIFIVVYRVVTRRHTTSSSTTSLPDVTGSNYRSDTNGKHGCTFDDLHSYTGADYIWQETGSDCDTESQFHPSLYRHHFNDPFYDDDTI